MVERRKTGVNLSLSCELVHRINECVGEGYTKKEKSQFNISIDIDLFNEMREVYEKSNIKNLSQFAERCTELGLEELGKDIRNKSFTDIFGDLAWAGLEKIKEEGEK